MPQPAKFSSTNILNSIALYTAGKLLDAGYLVYFQKRDVLLIPGASGWYFEFNANKATYLGDPTVAAAVATAKGLVTIVEALPAVPRFVVRLIDDASVGPAEVVSVPALSIELGAAVPLANYELGTRTKWRTRHLICDGYVRSDAEQKQFADWLALWFDDELELPIADHDAGDLATVGTVMVAVPRVVTDTIPQQDEATTYQVLLNARLTYVA